MKLNIFNNGSKNIPTTGCSASPSPLHGNTKKDLFPFTL